jgi:DNA-binding winged helix-turn-helix (wHTH) protein
MTAADTAPLTFEGFTLDPAARTLVGGGGEQISLRRSEFELLLAFVNSRGRALSRDYLLEAVAGRHSEAFDRSIDVLVGRPRRKIEREPQQPRLILTVPGIGYRFAAKPHPAQLGFSAMESAPAADLTRADALAEQALSTSPRSRYAHTAKGEVLRTPGRFHEAITEYETVIALDRNRVAEYTHLG